LSISVLLVGFWAFVILPLAAGLETTGWPVALLIKL
jgi:hypothetical protein